MVNFYYQSIIKMHFWYDTRYDWDQENLSKKGWMFPCYFCGQITSKYKTYKKNTPSNNYDLDLDVQTCKDCTKRNLGDIKEKYLTLYCDSKISNR